MDIVVDRHHGPPLSENEMFRTGRGDAALVFAISTDYGVFLLEGSDAIGPID
jgi:hypothetical protein